MNGMPLSEIGADLRDISHQAAQFVHSPQLAGTLRQIDGATANLDRMTGEMRSQLPPTLAELRRTVAEAQNALTAAHNLLSAQRSVGSAPGTEGLPETLYEISRTARSLRGLSDLLDQHPSALLTGRGR
jgi:paraquat-inducible protein B